MTTGYTVVIILILDNNFGSSSSVLAQALDGLRVRLGLKFKKNSMEFLLD